jgi:hypothetical protein
MTVQVFVPLLLAAVLAVYLGIAIRTAYRMRGKRVVVCPETKQPAGVTVDVGHAATTAVWEKADVRLKTCSRWPERHDCDQPCVAQIERQPDETRTKVIAGRFFEGKACAICHKPIDPPNAATLQPGFINPVTHVVKAWDEVAPAELPGATSQDLPLCPNCTLAESFRQRFPDRVTEKVLRPGTSLPPQ